MLFRSKMSKSLGNFFTVREILKVFDPEVVRFFILRTHYRSPLNYSDAHVADARHALSRLYTALKGVAGRHAKVDWEEPHAARFREAMDDDFNTSEAVAELQLLANLAFNGDSKAALQLKGLGAILGMLQRNPEYFLKGLLNLQGELDTRLLPYQEFEKKVNALIQARDDARKQRNFAEADRIRKELESLGVILEDSPTVTTWRRA